MFRHLPPGGFTFPMVAHGLVAQLFAGWRMLIDVLPPSPFLLEPPIFLLIGFGVPIAGELVVMSHIYWCGIRVHKRLGTIV